jgi:DNA-directed RNA polymerase subunit omega
MMVAELDELTSREAPSLEDYSRAAEKVGGRFRLTVLLQKRVRELVRGAAPLVDVRPGDSPIHVALREVLEGKVELVEPGAAVDRLVAAVERGAAAVAREREESGGKEEPERAKKARKAGAKSGAKTSRKASKES